MTSACVEFPLLQVILYVTVTYLKLGKMIEVAVNYACLCSRERVLSGAGMDVPLTTLCTSGDQSIELFQMRLALIYTSLCGHIVHTNLT